MEWIRAVKARGSKLWAEVESANGTTYLLALEELYQRGLPADEKTFRKKMTVSFQDLSACDANKFTAHFGLPVPDSYALGHQVFELRHKGKTYLVPALALMRSLFRPSTKLLHEMFAPSALERILWLDYSNEANGTGRIVIDAKWATSAAQKQNGNWQGPLIWMTTHPTARRMADSVHQHAMAGRLALDLASCEAEIVFSGVERPDVRLVTEVRFLSITPSEFPDLSVVGCKRKIEFIDRAWAKGRKIKETISAEIPKHADGSFEMTDKEWSVVGQILAGKRKSSRPYQLCQRTLFDGILCKLGTQMPWKRISYKVGDWRNASTSYHTWKNRGTLEQALAILREMR